MGDVQKVENCQRGVALLGAQTEEGFGILYLITE